MKYLHPSVETKITDNSFFFQTSDGESTLFQAIVADTGPDNELTFVTSPDEYKFKFGTPNLARHGQAGLNVLEWLKSGGVAYVIRVLPETATFACTGVALEMTKDTAANTVLVATRAMADGGPSAATSVAQLKTALTDAFKVEAESAYVPLGAVFPYGRGQGYNGLGIRLDLNSDLDATYPDFRLYSLSVTAKDSLGTDTVIEGPFTVALDPQARSTSRASLFWENVVNKYSQFIKVLALPQAQEAAAEFLLSVVDGGDAINPATIDVVYGRPRNDTETVTYAAWTFENGSTEAPTSDDPTELFKPNGANLLSGGSDGEWTAGNTEEALMVKAYSGLLDPAVLDTKFYEFDVILDGNTPPAVKAAMGDMASNYRGDCIALLDVGFQATPAQSIDERRDVVNVSHRNVSVFAQHLNVYDANSGSNIDVTTPYVLASKIPMNDTDFGRHWSFVGPRRGVVSGFNSINFIPNASWKEAMYKVQLNYIERDPKKYNFATHTTSQAQSSALSDIPNVRVVLKIKRDVENMMADYRMEFADQVTYDTMNSDLNAYLQQWTANRACSTVSGIVYASEYDRTQKIARVKVELVFTGFIERIAIDIQVNR